jgi:hypothetical protein
MHLRSRSELLISQSTLIKIQNQVKESLTPKTQTVKVDESQTVRESWHESWRY